MRDPDKRYWRRLALAAALAGTVAAGCQWYNDDADRQVYRLVEQRQRDALGAEHDARLPRVGEEPKDRAPEEYDNSAYQFEPHPIDNNAPPGFRRAISQSATTQPADGSTTQPTTQAVAAESRPARPVLTLRDALKYAFRHSREFQTAKEQLYIAALNLTLERHLWTPRFFGDISTAYTALQTLRQSDPDFPATYEPDQTLRTIAQMGIRQRLPYGGEITARVIDTLVHDLEAQVETGQSGQALLEANIPLLRGAGPAAYESRYQAERDLIYAVRTFEGFRRNLAVDIAGDYFTLQALRQAIVNAERSIEAFTDTMRRAEALWRTGRRIYLDVQRADQDRLFAINNKIAAIEQYQSSLDQFKIRLGMPTETDIDVDMPEDTDAEVRPTTTEPVDDFAAVLRMPDVPVDEAIRTALHYRLDLKNDFDRIYDAERGVSIAQNNLLPDLIATTSVLFNTDPNTESVRNFDDEHTEYRAGMTLEIPFDRVAERNALRRAHITRQQAERNYENARQLVTLQVRRALRRVQQQTDSLQVLILARNVAIERRRFAEIRLATKGDISNRDVVDAENALLQARNRLALAQAQLSLAILQFRRDTGTLRVNDDGTWVLPPPATDEVAVGSGNRYNGLAEQTGDAAPARGAAAARRQAAR